MSDPSPISPAAEAEVTTEPQEPSPAEQAPATGPEERPPAEDAPTKAKKKPRGERRSERGVETMFRTSYRNHIELTALADTKANIMLGFNGIIASLAIGFMPRLLSERPELGAAALTLVVGALISLVYAVLAARPRVTSDQVTLDDVRKNRASILFFGHFVNMRRDDYVTGMHELMDRSDLLYDNMVRDIHALGTVLALKYRLLRTSYNVFMFTLVVSGALCLAALIPAAIFG